MNNRTHCLYIIAVLLLIEYIIFQWAYTFGTDKVLTDHVSFAATIVSIILAIIAIVYGFIQSESQNRSSSQIAVQIESLRDTVKQVNSSSLSFTSELDRIKDIADRLNSIGSGVDQAQLGISQIEQKLENFLTNTFQRLKEDEVATPKQTTNTVPNNLSENEELGRKLIWSTYDSLILAYAIKLVPKDGISENDLLVDKLAMPISKLRADPNVSMENWQSEFTRRLWSSLQALRMFKAFNYVSISDKEEIVMPTKEFLKIIESIKYEKLSGVEKDLEAISTAFKEA